MRSSVPKSTYLINPAMLSRNAKRRVLMLTRIKYFTNGMGHFLDVVNVWSFKALQKILGSFFPKLIDRSFFVHSEWASN